MFGKVKSLILVDFDNVGSADMRRTIDRWMAWLEDGAFGRGERRRRFLAKRVYWNGKSDEHRADFERAGFEAFACRPIASVKADKRVSAVDLRLAAHAIDLAHRLKRKGLREVFLFSTDTDFVPIVDMLQEELGLRVVALAKESDSSSAVYRDHADVISTRELSEGFLYERRRGKPQPALADPAPSTPKPDRPAEPIEAAADRVAAMAARSPGLAIGRDRVIRALKAMPSFATTGARPWLGHRNYRGLMDEIVRRRPDQIEQRTDTNGSVHYYPND